MALSPSDFQLVSDLLRRTSATELEAGKSYYVESRLLALARATGLAGIEDVLARLRAGADAAFSRKVAEALALTETSFFRDVHPFEALRTELLPRLIAARRDARSLHVWCAACATGQEAYSVAILIREHFPQIAGWRVRVVGTDYSQEAIAKAREGLYSQVEVNRGLPPALLAKYFVKEGTGFRVADTVRRAVEFAELNLASPTWGAAPPSDVVLLRNVLPQFDAAMRRQVLDRAARLMRPEGSIVLGAAESMLGILGGDEGWGRQVIGKSVCYRPGALAA